MKFILLAIFFIFTLRLSAQYDIGTKSMSIAPAGGNMNVAPSGNAINNPPIFSGGSTSSDKIESAAPNSKFGQIIEFANPNARVEEKLNKRHTEENTAPRQNEYMGDFKTKSKTVKVQYRDYGEVDGDIIKVYVNDKILKNEIMMDREFQGFELTLAPGFNKLDFEALNQGLYGPNTAEFEVFDDNGALISSHMWNLATGFKATIIVVQE